MAIFACLGTMTTGVKCPLLSMYNLYVFSEYYYNNVIVIRLFVKIKY